MYVILNKYNRLLSIPNNAIVSQNTQTETGPIIINDDNASFIYG